MCCWKGITTHTLSHVHTFNHWPDTGELGVCWAPQELEGTISQETLHEAMTYLLVTI